MAVFGCFARGERLYRVLVDMHNRPRVAVAFRLIYCVNDFFDRFHEKIEVIRQIRVKTPCLWHV